MTNGAGQRQACGSGRAGREALACGMRLPVELLAPAGGREQLEYAVRFGADAVYLATDRFGMRRRASNFRADELADVVAWAHERGVAVHVACNIVMRQGYLSELADYLELVGRSGADALIVSDLGAMRLARRHAPGVALHVSTQASVANAEAALAWYELGARRIVCAREMSLADIAAMRAQIPDDLELEVFAHGSMCMAYSGRCLISDYLTGRSANEGDCTQPCRWAWELREPSRPGQAFAVEEDLPMWGAGGPASDDGVAGDGEAAGGGGVAGREGIAGRAGVECGDGATYLFNSRDLNMIAHLGKLAAAGVNSIKIEGRGRKAFFTATVVGAYRRALDGADPGEVAAELEKVSHRPYSTGFFFGPAHQAPASAASDSEWLWAAEVIEAREASAACEALVVARNRFDCTSEFEVLSPGEPARPLRIADLRWVHAVDVTGGADGTDGAADIDADRAGTDCAGTNCAGAEVAEPVACANRQMDRYLFSCDVMLRPHDIVRARKTR